MTAPNIEMIANSLRNCSLNYQNTPGSPSSSSSSTSSSSSYPRDSALAPPPPLPDLTGRLTVELNSDVALPFHWEQCLDIRSGQVYYINWEDGTRTTVDPRAREPSIDFYDSSSDNPEEEEEEEELDDSSSNTDSCSGVNTTESSYTSNVSSNRSSFSPTESSSSGGYGAFSATSNSTANGGGEVLVAAGCKACFMYFMVPKHGDICPKCGGSGLLHLGRV